MILKCNRCEKTFDDKYYKMNDNQEGFRDELLTHIRRHNEDEDIKENFTKIKLK